jgi:hypothetical protein
MPAQLVNHLGIPGGVPKLERLDDLERVGETFEPYGGEWLARGPVLPKAGLPLRRHAMTHIATSLGGGSS